MKGVLCFVLVAFLAFSLGEARSLRSDQFKRLENFLRDEEGMRPRFDEEGDEEIRPDHLRREQMARFMDMLREREEMKQDENTKKDATVKDTKAKTEEKPVADTAKEEKRSDVAKTKSDQEKPTSKRDAMRNLLMRLRDSEEEDEDHDEDEMDEREQMMRDFMARRNKMNRDEESKKPKADKSKSDESTAEEKKPASDSSKQHPVQDEKRDSKESLRRDFLMKMLREFDGDQDEEEEDDDDMMQERDGMEERTERMRDMMARKSRDQMKKSKDAPVPDQAQKKPAADAKSKAHASHDEDHLSKSLHDLLQRMENEER